MHTLKVIAGGIALLGLILLLGRWAGSPAAAAKLFIPIWLIAAGINMWIGVSKAGYTVADEAPVLLVVFAVPAALALLVLWKLSRG